MQRTIQEIACLIAFGTIVVLGLLMRKFRNHWYYAIAPLTWLIHTILFYFCVFLRDAGVDLGLMDFTFWSSLVRLHGVCVMAGIVVALLTGKVQPYHE